MLGAGEDRTAGRPPHGLLSEPLWRALANTYAADEHGLSYRRQPSAWIHLNEYRYRRGKEPFVTATARHPPQPQPTTNQPARPAATGINVDDLFEAIGDVLTDVRDAPSIP